MNFEHSDSPQEVKFQFTWQASYDLPVGKGRLVNLNGPGNAVLGGWTMNGIAYLSDGIPINAPVVGAGFSYFNQRTNMTCRRQQRRTPYGSAVVLAQLLYRSGKSVCGGDRAGVSWQRPNHGGAGSGPLSLQEFHHWERERPSF